MSSLQRHQTWIPISTVSQKWSIGRLLYVCMYSRPVKILHVNHQHEPSLATRTTNNSGMFAFIFNLGVAIL